MASKLSETFWNLTHFVKNKALQPVIPGTRITAYFGDQGSLIGFGGCNTYIASYQILLRNPPGISITDLMSTLMHCSQPAGIMEQEERYFAGLLAATEITEENGQLKLSWPDHALVFEAAKLKKH